MGSKQNQQQANRPPATDDLSLARAEWAKNALGYMRVIQAMDHTATDKERLELHSAVLSQILMGLAIVIDTQQAQATKGPGLVLP